MGARVLILDGNTDEGTAKIVSLGAQPYGEGYTAALRFFEPDLEVFVLRPANAESLPAGTALTDFDGIAWTGSPLSAYEARPEVARQIEMARAVHAAGVPCFGSCWGQQIMCQALGGEVRANPKGLEIGIARGITLTDAGMAHPMFARKSSPFDALCIHRDEVVTLPQGGRVLAHNAMSGIQAMELAGAQGNLWAVQYHPEFDFHLMAVLLHRDAQALVDQAICASPEEARALADAFERLHRDPADEAAAARLDAGRAVRDPAVRMAELGNWLREKVLPHAAART
ncbi:MAG: type 1 glutamine amidotransferase [Alphaproteobacteria bacterium]|nr:MAG: type 1 glutamine amidotransferase [Alphaproteobacteria bacterium]